MSAAPMIYGLIPKIMKDIGGVAKTHKNEQQRYAFRGIEDFYEAAQPALIEHGVFCAPKVLERDEYRFEKTNDQGRTTTWLHVALKVEHRFFAADGSSIEVTTWGEGLDNSDKATNKAMSGAMKYALIELFCVPTKDIEDSDRTSPETGKRRPPVPVTQQDIDLGPVGNRADVKPLEKGSASGAVHHPAGQYDITKGIHATVSAESPTLGPPAVIPADDKIWDEPVRSAPGENITQGQAVYFARKFKESLRKELQKDAENLRHHWLELNGFKDVNGIPTALAITSAAFDVTVREACGWAKKQ